LLFGVVEADVIFPPLESELDPRKAYEGFGLLAGVIAAECFDNYFG